MRSKAFDDDIRAMCGRLAAPVSNRPWRGFIRTARDAKNVWGPMRTAMRETGERTCARRRREALRAAVSASSS